MPFQLSPGVATREIDLTNVVPTLDSSTGAFVGQFQWGPVLKYATISDQSKLVSGFGKPGDVNFTDWFSASNFLDYTGKLVLIRVVDEGDAFNAVANGAGVLIKNDDHFEVVGPTTTASIYVARYPGLLGNDIQVHIADSVTYTGWAYEDLFDAAPGTSDFSTTVGATGALDEIHVVIVDGSGDFTGTKGAVLEQYAFLSKNKANKTLDGAPNFYGNIINQQSAYVWYVDVPPSADYVPQGAITGIAVTAAGVDYTSAPTVTVSGAGTLAAATAVLEATGGLKEVTINVAGTGYDDTDTVVVTGDGAGATAAIVTSGGVITGVTITNAGTGYTTITSVLVTTGVGINGDLTGVVGYGVASVTVDVAGSGYTAPTVAFAGDGSGATATATPSVTNDDWNTVATVGTVFKSLTAATSDTLTNGTDGSLVTANELIVGWNLFKNAEIIDVSLLFVGDAGGAISSAAVITHVIDNVAELRKDVVTFFSPDHADIFNLDSSVATDNIVAFRNTKINRQSSYAVMDSGYKSQYDAYNDVYRWIPLNADIAGLAARTDRTNAPWYSPAGPARGLLKNVIQLMYSPGQTERDTLYKNAVNPVISFPGVAPMLFGDRTQQLKSAAFSKINIRRLFITLRKSIAVSARNNLFEFNDEFTRGQFRSTVEPYLAGVQSRRGIIEFAVICDETNNPPEVVDKSEFIASIFIKPNNSINFILLNFVAVRGSVEFSEVTGAV